MQTINEKEAMLDKLNSEFSKVTTYVEQASGREPIHQVEQEMFRKLMEIGRSLLEYFIAQSGTGYQANNPPRSEDGKALTFKGIVESPYFSIFGEVKIKRAGYASDAEEYVYPLDVQLNLPEKKFSYLLQRWILARSAETDFREAVAWFNEIFDRSFFPSMPQRTCAAVAPTVTGFYEQSCAPAPETEGTHIGISVDGKGVRIRRSERQSQEPTSVVSKARRGKGEKPGIKKQATVTADFSFHPQARSPEEIVKALLNQYTDAERKQAKSECHLRSQQALEEPREALNKHVRATLAGKDKAMGYLIKRLEKRDPSRQKPIVVLIDGDPSLENALTKALETNLLKDRIDAFILDLIHVSEYVWNVGTALHGEKAQARIAWVRDKLLSILQSEVSRVIGGLKQTLTKTKLCSSQKKALEKAITYFENHRHMMDYASYLAKGYPIATGLVEGTCGSLVKDRMEQSGMRWSIQGAQSVLELRAVKLNNDWDQFWQFHIMAEQNRLYPTTYNIAA